MFVGDWCYFFLKCLMIFTSKIVWVCSYLSLLCKLHARAGKCSFMHRDPVFSKGVSQMTAFCFGALMNLAQSSHHRENRSAHWDGRMPLILSPALHSEQTKKISALSFPLGRERVDPCIQQSILSRAAQRNGISTV